MIATNDLGQMLIEDANRNRAINKVRIIELIRSVFINLDNGEIEVAKKNVYQAYEFTNESRRSAYLAVNGLKLLVLNELSDAQNHSQLMHVGQDLVEEVWVEFSYLASEPLYNGNVISFRKHRVKKKLTGILLDFCTTK